MTSLPNFSHPDDLIQYAIKYEIHTDNPKERSELLNLQSPNPLKVEFANIQREIDKFERYFERGMVDHVVIRELMKKHANRLQYLKKELTSDFARENLLNEKVKIKNELKELFAKYILFYSIVSLDMDSQELKFMVVPEIFKTKTAKWFEDFDLLSSESPLGEEILCKTVGTEGSYAAPEGRHVPFYIKSTQIASLETLNAISESYEAIIDSYWVNPYPISSRVYNNAVLPSGNGGERRKDQLRP